MTWPDVLSSLRGKKELPPIPESFIFGVATADHQCEAYDLRYVDIRDVWERVQHPDAARGNATDFWNRYSEDIDLAKSLGCNAFRFSIAWSRVEPEPGEYNQEAFDHYRDLIDKILSCDMQPVVTLHHFTWPLHVEKRGGMIGDQFSDIYASYVSEVVKRFGKDVPYWITFNEPNLLMGGYLKPWWDSSFAAPPGLEGATTFEQVEAVERLVQNLFLAHRAAYEIIKGQNPDAKVGVNAYFYGLPDWLQHLVDGNATRIKETRDLQSQSDRISEKRALIGGKRANWIKENLLNRDKADVVIAALTMTSEREEQVAFSEPYFVAGMQLMVRADRDENSDEDREEGWEEDREEGWEEDRAEDGEEYRDEDRDEGWNIDRASSIEQVKDLEGKTIAVVKGSTAEKSLHALSMPIKGAKPLSVPDYGAALQALQQGTADAMLSDNAILHGLMEQHPGQYRLIDEAITDDELYAAAVAIGESDLLEALNLAVRDFKRSPQWQEWADKLASSGQPVEKPPRDIKALTISEPAIERSSMLKKAPDEPMPISPKGTAIRRIQDRGYLKVAIKSDMPGFGYLDPETGEFSGLEADIARSLANRIFGDPGMVKFCPVTTEKRLPSVRSLGLLDWFMRQYTVLSTMFASNWWYLGMAGELDEFLCPKECAGKFDFVGLDYYWGISTLQLDRIQRLMDAAYRRFDRAPVWPGGLHSLLKDLSRQFPDKPLLIFENGCVESADGVGREVYIQRHIQEVQRALKDGVNVDGYICWAVTSNREWDLQFNEGSDFGLFHIDLDSDMSLKRVHTPAAEAYRDIILKRGV